jgi:hypothetical protein
MYNEINKKIVAAREQGRLQGIWNKRLHNLEEELKEREQQTRMWELQLKKEEEDVEKLKGISFSSFLYTVLLKKEERLEHEHMEKPIRLLLPYAPELTSLKRSFMRCVTGTWR